MEHPTKARISLFAALEAEGWSWEKNRLYAPSRTFWVEGTRGQQTPLPMLVLMYERMKAALDTLAVNRPAHLEAEQYQCYVSDTESLVTTLSGLVERARGAL